MRSFDKERTELENKINKEKELEFTNDYKMSLKDIDLLRDGLVALIDSNKKEAIEVETKSYYTDEKKEEELTRLSKEMIQAEILKNKIWENTNLYEALLKPSFDLDYKLSNK